MKIALFYHSVFSDWNNGNAHFLRGYATELIRRGHAVTIYEPRGGWSYRNLLLEPCAIDALVAFRTTYPHLASVTYDENEPDLDHILDGVDLVIVHEWNEPAVVRAIARHRAGNGGYRLLFHDTHHRMATQPASFENVGLGDFDGVLAYGSALRDLYRRTWGERVWVWHEAADTRVFRPLPGRPAGGDIVWIGNWGDDERRDELRDYLVGPVRDLELSGTIYGVRYPDDAVREVERAGLTYAGWLPNVRAPAVFAAHRVTVHVPRRPYVELLPGIPTIRPFEALACGIPLIMAPWIDTESLFREGTDHLVAHSPGAMRGHLRAILQDEELRSSLIRAGLETIRARHTCAHRVDELLAIVRSLDGEERGRTTVAAAERRTE